MSNTMQISDRAEAYLDGMIDRDEPDARIEAVIAKAEQLASKRGAQLVTVIDVTQADREILPDLSRAKRVD